MTLAAPRLVVRSADPLRSARALLRSDQRVVAASAGAARALGLTAGAPSLALLARRALRAQGRVAGALLRRQALRRACEDEFGADVAAGYAARGQAAVHAWLRSGVALDDHASPPDGPSERVLRWWRVSRRYRTLLRELDAVDPVEVARLVAATALPPTPLALVGFGTLEDDEIALVDALAGPGSLLTLPRHEGWSEAVDSVASALEGRGWQLLERDEPPPTAAIAAWRAPTLEHEVRAAFGAVKRALLDGTCTPDQVVVVTRESERYAATARAVASEYGLALRLRRRVPMRSTPLGAWLGTLLDALADDLPFEATAALLRHPFCGLLDHGAFDAARRWRPRGRAAWRRALTRSERRDEGHAALEALAPFLSRGRRPAGTVGGGAVTGDAATGAAAWREAIERMLDTLLCNAARSAQAPALLLWSRALDDALRASERSPTRAAALRTVRDVLNALTLPDDLDALGAEAPRGAVVEMVTPEALAGARVDWVVLLGAAEGVFPATVTDPPLFDAVDRDELRALGIGVATPAELARRERLAAWQVWRAAERLWLSYPEQTGRDARLPSALFDALGVEPAALPNPAPASPAERRQRDLLRAPASDDGDDSVLEHARHAWRVEERRERAPERDAYDGLLGVALDAESRRWSASQLTTFGQCRFRWLLQSAWGVRVPEEGATEVTPLLRGSLYHHALALALAHARGQRGAEARASASAALPQAFERAERHTDADAVPHWRHLRHEHLAHLQALIEAPGFLPDEHEVVDVERRFDGRWHGLQVTGRVDRIDRTPDGVVVIDYKTGSSRPPGARGFDGERLDLELQLPLYVEVAAPQLVPGERVAAARYYSLGALRDIPRETPDAAETEDFIARLRASLGAGDFPVEPSDACRYCPLEAACRKGPRLARKHAPAAPEGPQ